MTIEQSLYQQIRQLGYWDRTEQIQSFTPSDAETLAWSNPNTTADPEMMFQLIWLLSSSSRCKRLSPIDVRILDRTAVDLIKDGHALPATKSYVKYLWQQVYSQEMAQQSIKD